MDTTPTTRVDPEGPLAWHTGPADVLYVASWWQRFAAYLIDQIITSIVLIGGLLAVSESGSDPLFIATVISGVLIYVLYNPLMVALNHGQTLGKKLIAMRVINQDVTPTGLGRAVVREVLFKTFGGFLSPFNLIDYLWAAARKDRRSLHDLAAGTVVVQA